MPVHRRLLLSLLTALLVALVGCTSPYAPQPKAPGYPTAERLPTAAVEPVTSQADADEPASETEAPAPTAAEAKDEAPATEQEMPAVAPTIAPEPRAWMSFSNLDDVRDLHEASDGRIWAATGGGVVIWDLDTVSHTVVRVEEGLPSNDVRAIAETADGAVWIGTSAGVARVEGDQVVGTVGETVLGGGNVQALLADRQGRLWVGTQGAGAVRYDGESWQPLHFADNVQGNNVYSLFEDAQGRIWFGGMGLAYLDGEQWTTLDDEAVSGQGILSIASDRQGNIWLGTPFALVRYREGAFETLSFPRMALYTVNDIWEDRNGQVWLATEKGGLWTVEGSVWTQQSENSGLPASSIRQLFVDGDGRLLLATDEGLYEQVGDAWRPYLVGNAPSGNEIRSLLVDDTGILWVGVRGRPLCAYNGVSWHEIGEGASRPTNITALDQTPDGFVWAADPGHGVWRIDSQGATLISAQDGLASNQVTGLTVDAEGVLWVSTMEGISRRDGENWSSHTTAQGLLGDQIVGIDADGDVSGQGVVWAAAVTDGVMRYRDGTWNIFAAESGLPAPRASCLAADGEGVWLGYAASQLGARRQLAFFDGASWSFVSEDEGLPAADPQCLLIDQGWLWLGTKGLGLARYSDDTRESWTSADGLASDNVTALASDGHGVLWVGTDAGLSRVDTALLD